MASTIKRWTIEFSRTAEEQIRKVDRKAQETVVRFQRERLQSADDPRQWGKPLRGEKCLLWRYRLGDYRLICDIQDEKVTVLALAVGHQKDGYR